MSADAPPSHHAPIVPTPFAASSMAMAWRTLLFSVALNAQVVAADGSRCLTGEESRPAESSSHRYEMFASAFTHHWTHSPEHKPAGAITLSRALSGDRYRGFGVFSNSFGQPSAVAYTGWMWPTLLESRPVLYGRMTVGVMYGYVDRYRHKVPLNIDGFSPVIIPALGYRLSPGYAVEIQILGKAAVVLGLAVRF